MPARVTLPSGSASTVVPVEPVAVGSVWVTATLPAGLGGGSTSALLQVRPVAVAPRRAIHRMMP